MTRLPATHVDWAARINEAWGRAQQSVAEGKALKRFGAARGWPKPRAPKPVSVASAPKASVVYFIEAEGSGRIKIGTTDRLDKRLAALRASSPLPLNLIATIAGDFNDERRLHHRFAHLRLHGEWFSAAPELLAFLAGHAGK